MPRKKLKRFAEIETFPNVIRWPENVIPGWLDHYFGNSNPITLETACGKGEYTVGLARGFPERNFIGIDKKGERIWRGARIAREEGLSNALFIQSDVGRIVELFGEKSISEIWITFPDPFPKKNQESRRLTSPGFLKLYSRVITPEGFVHLKTDDDDFFRFTIDSLKTLKCVIHQITFDLYGDSIIDELLTMKTTFERRHLEAGRSIKYVRFGFAGIADIRK